MRNNAIARIISGARKNKREYSNQDIKKIQKNIDMVVKCYKQLLSENEDLREDQIRTTIMNELINSNNEYIKRANNRGLLFQLEGINYLLSNRETMEKIHKEIEGENIDEEKVLDLMYNSDLKRTCRNLIKLAVVELDGMQKDLETETQKFFREYENADINQRRKLEERYSKQDFKKIKDVMPMYVGSYTSRVEGYLKNLREYVEKDIRDQQYDVMSHIHDLLDQFGLVDRYLKIQNNQMKRETGLDLEYELLAENPKEIGADEIFTKEFLEKQSLEDVLTYSAFWQNRYSKVWNDIGQGIYAVDTLKLWRDIAKGQEKFDIDLDKLKALLNKESCLKELSMHVMSALSQNAKTVKDEDKIEDNCVKIFAEDTIEKYRKQEGENYKNIFDEILSSSNNDFKRDMEMYSALTAQIMNTYKVKDAIMVYKIRSLFESKRTKNWGIVLDEVKNGKENNPLDSNSKNVLIGIDYEGFNMPLRLHIPRELLTSLLYQYKGDAIIPIYEGTRDFVNNGEILTTNILMPISKKHGKLISEAVNRNNGEGENNDLLEHLLFLKDKDKYPKHLKKKIVTKKGITYERPPKRYVDLMSGDEYCLDGKTFVKVEEGIKDGNSR